MFTPYKDRKTVPKMYYIYTLSTVVSQTYTLYYKKDGVT